MTEYKTQKIIEPIIVFIKTCPFLAEFHINVDDIDTQQFSTSNAPGTAIDYNGSNVSDDTIYVNGERGTERQANFALYFLRKSSTNPDRTEIADFIFNFEHWVEHSQYYGETPKIGDSPDRETMWADNGMYFGEWETKGGMRDVSQYMIQLHILYQKRYPDKNESILGD